MSQSDKILEVPGCSVANFSGPRHTEVASLPQREGGGSGSHGAITFIPHFHLHAKIHRLHSALRGGDSQQTRVPFSGSEHVRVDGVRVAHADGTGDTNPTDVHRELKVSLGEAITRDHNQAKYVN